VTEAYAPPAALWLLLGLRREVFTPPLAGYGPHRRERPLLHRSRWSEKLVLSYAQTLEDTPQSSRTTYPATVATQARTRTSGT